MTLLQTLTQRGLIQQLTHHDIIHRLLKENHKFKLYCGVDPTAKSIHLGNLIPMMVQLQFHIQGHDIVNVVGGATGAVGDPTGRLIARTQMDTTQREANVSSITDQLSYFFHNGVQYAQRKGLNVTLGTQQIRNNMDWLQNVDLLEFLTQFGPHIRVQSMLNRDSVTTRLSTGQLTFNEFTYQILQAYDFYQLNKQDKVDVQVGGNDQWGNIVAGIDLINKISSVNENGSVGNAQVFGITTPLLTTQNGTKFGKSNGNAVFIDKKLNSPLELYQYFFNCHDSQVKQWLKLFTMLPLEEISILIQEHSLQPQKRLAQLKLAQEITELIHGPTASSDSSYISQQIYSRDTSTISIQPLIKMLDRSGHIYRTKSENILDILCETLQYSKSQARKLLPQVRIGPQRLAVDASSHLDSKCWIEDQLLLVFVGKQRCLTVLKVF